MKRINSFEYATRVALVRTHIQSHSAWIESRLGTRCADMVFIEVDTPVRRAAMSAFLNCPLEQDSDSIFFDALMSLIDHVEIPEYCTPYLTLAQGYSSSAPDNSQPDSEYLRQFEFTWEDCPIALTLGSLKCRIISLSLEYQSGRDGIVESNAHLLIVPRAHALELLGLLGKLQSKDRQSKLHMPNTPARVIAPCDWNQLVLDRSIVTLLKNDFQSFFERKDWFNSMRLPFRRGYLLHGPPGNGKTTAVRAMLTSRGLSAHSIRLFDPRTDDSDIDHLFSRAERSRPSVVLLEDLDRAFPRTGETKSRLSLQYLLNALDGVGTGEGIIVIATANEPTALDPAILRRPGRFDRVVHFPNPDAELRREYFVRMHPGLKREHLDNAVAASSGLSFAFLREAYILAGQRAFEANRNVQLEDIEIGIDLLRLSIRESSQRPSNAGFSSFPQSDGNE